MFYDFAILVPAATAESDLIKYTLKLTYGIITHVYVEFPAGCRGYAYLTLDWEGHQLYPTNPDGAFNTEDYIIPIEDRFPLLFQPYSLYAKVWAPQTTYDHTLTVRIEVLEPDLLYPEARLPASLEKLITFLGGVPTPPPEEVVPPAPTPPAPTPPLAPPAPTPVCTLGETRCEGYDLYECQEVEGEAAWVVKEKNSTSCGYTPPPPPPTPPTPPTPPNLAGRIQYITWEYEGVIHPMSDPEPEMVSLLHHFKVVNTGDEAYLKIGEMGIAPLGGEEVWAYSAEKIISPGEGVIDWKIWTGWHQTTRTYFHLFADGKKVDTMSVTITVYCRGLCG